MLTGAGSGVYSSCMGDAGFLGYAFIYAGSCASPNCKGLKWCELTGASACSFFYLYERAYFDVIKAGACTSSAGVGVMSCAVIRASACASLTCRGMSCCELTGPGACASSTSQGFSLWVVVLFGPALGSLWLVWAKCVVS